eukprot:12532910-Alexandrium_andersonii.AAC.1
MSQVESGTPASTAVPASPAPQPLTTPPPTPHTPSLGQSDSTKRKLDEEQPTPELHTKLPEPKQPK